jgi:hypothetical protein
MKNVRVFGCVNDRGQLAIADLDRFNKFMQENKGNAVSVVVELLGKEPSETQKAYYYHVVLPELYAAMHEEGEVLTVEEAEQELKYRHPLMHSIERGVNGANLAYQVKTARKTEDVDMRTLSHFIAFLLRHAADRYGIYIPEPRER